MVGVNRPVLFVIATLLLTITTPLHAAGSMVNLGTLADNASSIVSDISADGAVIVGSSAGQALLWTQAGGMANLGAQIGFTHSIAVGVSADGSVVVGSSESGDYISRTYRWTQTGGDSRTLPLQRAGLHRIGIAWLGHVALLRLRGRV